MNRFIACFSSLKLTISLLACAMLLVFAGTIAEVYYGIFYAQNTLFRSFLIFYPGTSIPLFPGGYLLALFILLNLAISFGWRLKSRKVGAPLLIIHAGLVLLIGGELITGLFAKEHQMPVHIGQIRNFAEDPALFECVIIDCTEEAFDHVAAVPARVLQNGKINRLRGTPLSLITRAYFPHSRIAMAEGEGVVNRGIGTSLAVQELPEAYGDVNTNTVTAVVELLDGEASIGRWLVTNAFPDRQTFFYKGREYQIGMQRARQYFPFSVKLNAFLHETHPGTSIPKTFSSTVTLFDEEGKQAREALITMNEPLRYRGLTFYQASYGDNDALSVFQVVENPGKQIPYWASAIVACGLLLQFFAGIKRGKR